MNGRGALYLASHAYAIEGMEQAAAQKLIGELIDAATNGMAKAGDAMVAAATGLGGQVDVYA